MKTQNRLPVRGLCEISCPQCHGKDFWKHGSYKRTWFHTIRRKENTVRIVQRYLCLNTSCKRCTFTVQSADVLPYCRFLVPDLLNVDTALQTDTSLHGLQRIFGLRRTVLRRVSTLLDRTTDFLRDLCREITAGDTVSGLSELFTTAQLRYCWITLGQLWFRHFYNPIVKH